MKLDIQIYSFIVSFLFGCCFYFFLDIFNHLVYKLKLFFKIFLSFLFILSLSIVYFIILLFINNGVIHIYFLLMILVGYIFVNYMSIRWLTHFKKK